MQRYACERNSCTPRIRFCNFSALIATFSILKSQNQPQKEQKDQVFTPDLLENLQQIATFILN